MNTNIKSNKDELGALWKRKSKSGLSFLTGYVKVDDLGIEKEIKVVVFANSKKSNEKAPDYRIYVSKPMDTKELSQDDVVESPKSQKTPKKTQVVASEELL
jgi:uncharacterized protein (DUF736 family)